ncbi:MAG: metalloregulator ArsR/SmtB family transcription factor [Candidatus Dormiibacterota bacterium]
MPLSAEEDTRAVASVTVGPSAVVEIYGFATSARREETSSAASPELARRLRGFWSEEDRGGECDPAFDELLVYAAMNGALAAESAEPFLTRLPELATRDPGPLLLRTEREDVRAVVERHLAVLRDDARRRRTYVALMRASWNAIRERWETVGLPRVQARVDRLRSELERGEPLVSLLPARHLALKPFYRPLLDEAAREGRLVVAPGFFGGGHLLYDLPGALLVGIRLSTDDPADEARRRTKGLSERFRALGDPTRLAIAAHLGSQPATVSELAAAFNLAQPTVSAHVRGLREADLLESERADGRTRYRLAEGQFDDLFRTAKERLFGD